MALDIPNLLRTQPRRLRYLLPPDPATRTAIDRLRADVRLLPELPEEPATEAARRWLEDRRAIRKCIAERDPRQFLTWPPVVAQMVALSPDIARHELPAVRGRDLREDPIGAPPITRYAPRSSVNLIHGFYHAERFRQATGKSISQFESVFEFGGGYGSFCRVGHREGFKGTWHIYDFPEVTALQGFYLSEVPSTAQADIRLHNERGSLPSVQGRTLFVATWSLSEAPLHVRDGMRPLLDRADAFLIAYQAQRDGIDNRTWFEHLANRRDDVRWERHPIHHLGGSHYLFGIS